jgi:hypothetical protein
MKSNNMVLKSNKLLLKVYWQCMESEVLLQRVNMLLCTVYTHHPVLSLK